MSYENDGRPVRQNCEEHRGGRREKVSRHEGKKTHETREALLVEVTDGGGRVSTGLEEVEWEEPEAALCRL